MTRRDPFIFAESNQMSVARPAPPPPPPRGSADKCIISIIPPLLTKSPTANASRRSPPSLLPVRQAHALHERDAGVIKPGSLLTLAGHVTLHPERDLGT